MIVKKSVENDNTIQHKSFFNIFTIFVESQQLQYINIQLSKLFA